MNGEGRFDRQLYSSRRKKLRCFFVIMTIKGEQGGERELKRGAKLISLNKGGEKV